MHKNVSVKFAKLSIQADFTQRENGYNASWAWYSEAPEEEKIQ